MSASLPAYPPRARSITGVVSDAFAALRGTSEVLPPARSAIVWVVDGLGAHNLAARRGHARLLGGALNRSSVARTVFPSTTAAALTSLLTGTDPGRHGIVGYRVRVPGTDEAPNQLRGWETDRLDPLTWQRATPLLTSAAAAGRPVFVVTRPEYVSSGLTVATVRGAEIRGAEELEERAAIAADLAAQHPGALVYAYTPELDTAGHRSGWESEEWLTTLEGVDAALRRFVERLAPGVGSIVTADHGMIDVPPERRFLLGEGDRHWDGVAVVGGEPRMLHLYADDGRADDVLRVWTEMEQHRSWVFSREDAIAHGLFGHVDDPVRARIGDVVVAARAGVAYYDDRLPDKRPQRMVGQHGSLTVEERIVPALRFGAFA
jgi:hypothetical protein